MVNYSFLETKKRIEVNGSDIIEETFVSKKYEI